MADTGGWNTIESDAGVFTYLIERLGVQNVQFEELLTLEEEELIQLSPVYGVIFLFKYPTETPAAPPSHSNSSQPPDGTYDDNPPEDLFFATQTIQNACGTQAILSILLNHSSTIPVGPTLSAFHAFTTSFPPQLRGETLTNSPEIRAAHNHFARSSPFISDGPHPPSSPEDAQDVYHFIAYTPAHGTLYELDGLHRAPIAHGPCPDPTDSNTTTAAFATALLPVLRRRIARHGAAEIRFAALALCGDLRLAAAARGDAEMEAAQAARRREWRAENALRSWNAVGFVAEVLRAVVRGKVKQGGGAYEAWVGEAEEETRKAVEGGRERRRKMREEKGEGKDGDGDGDGDGEGGAMEVDA